MIVPITATATVDDMMCLSAAQEQGLYVVMAMSDTTDLLLQLYAYAGFSRAARTRSVSS